MSTRTEDTWADALKRPSKQGPGLWQYVAGEMKQLCAKLEHKLIEIGQCPERGRYYSESQLATLREESFDAGFANGQASARAEAERGWIDAAIKALEQLKKQS